MKALLNGAKMRYSIPSQNHEQIPFLYAFLRRTSNISDQNMVRIPQGVFKYSNSSEQNQDKLRDNTDILNKQI